MALITDKIVLNPKATGSLPSGTEGSLAYDSTTDTLKQYGTAWTEVNKYVNINIDRPGDGLYTSDEYTVLLVHSNTTNNSQAFVDSGVNAHTITYVGNAKHDTGKKKIGTTSILFNNASTPVTDWLSLPDSDDWDFGTGDFTIDFWCYPLGYGISGYGSIVTFTDISNTGNNMRNLRYDSTGPLHWDGDPVMNMSSNTSHNVWTHIAMTRNGTTVKFWKNGVLDSTHTGVTHNYTSLGSGIHIGSSWLGYTSAHGWYGFIEEFRISKGIARWDANFLVY